MMRRCLVCQQPIEHRSARHTTCGHPRCVRTNRGNGRLVKERRGLVTPPKPPPYDPRALILRAWDETPGDGWEKVLTVARAQRATIAQVMSVVRSRK